MPPRDLAGRADAVFPAAAPGWPSARLHSPDVQIAAAASEALDRGEFLLVLGELHPARSPFDSAVLSPFHPDPAALRAELDADLGPTAAAAALPGELPPADHPHHLRTDRARRPELGIDTAARRPTSSGWWRPLPSRVG